MRLGISIDGSWRNDCEWFDSAAVPSAGNVSSARTGGTRRTAFRPSNRNERPQALPGGQNQGRRFEGR